MLSPIIESMKAGPELNALVAEKVMGWSALRGIDEISKHFPDTSKICSPHLAEVWINDAGERMACKECGNMPAYSTQIADAWLVVEKLGKSFDVSRCRKFQEIEAWFWEASFHNGPDAQADTAPLAICLAALKAIGYERVSA